MSYIQTLPDTRGGSQLGMQMQSKMSGGQQYASDIAKMSAIKAPGLNIKNQMFDSANRKQDLGSYGLSSKRNTQNSALGYKQMQLTQTSNFANTQLGPKNVFSQNGSSRNDTFRASATAYSNQRSSQIGQKNFFSQNRQIGLPIDISQAKGFDKTMALPQVSQGPASRNHAARHSVDIGLNQALSGIAESSNGFMANRNSRGSKARQFGRNKALYSSMCADQPSGGPKGLLGDALLVGQSVDLGTLGTSRSPTKLEGSRGQGRNAAHDSFLIVEAPNGQRTTECSPRIDMNTGRGSNQSPRKAQQTNRSKTRYENQSVDAATAQKLFGTITVQEMALSGVKNALSEYGIPGYQVNSELRFNFHNKDHLIPGTSKLNRFLDTLMAQKAKIPSPDKYTGHRESFVDKRKVSIYTTDRKSFCLDIEKKAKLVPGPAQYDTARFDEKYVKPPKTSYTKKAEKYSYVDEIQFVAKQTPLIYEAIQLDKIKKRTIQWKIRGETQNEKDIIKKRYAKNNSPSPVTYKKGEALDKTAAFNKQGVNHKIGAEKGNSWDRIAKQSKKTPGVGKYNPHLAIDKVYRPMKSKGY